MVFRVSKAVNGCMPFRRNYTAEQMVLVSEGRIIRYPGVPRSIISDKNKLSTSN